MTTIPRAYVDNFTRVINGISDDAQKKLAKALEGVVIDDIAAARNEIIAIMDTLLAPYTDNVAAVAATFYDGLRAYFGIDDGFMAESESMREPAATAGAVRAFMQTQVDGKPFETLENLLTERVDYECKRAANECIAYNAKNDPKRPKWARVPTGAETCMWCIMLASRGFAYLSEEAASHTHANCDCRVIPSWDKDNPAVQGYDPELYYDMWKNPEKYAKDNITKETISVLSERRFSSVSSIEEATKFAERFVDTSAYKSKIDLKGMNLDAANSLLKVLDAAYDAYDVEPLRSIQRMNKRSSEFKNSVAEAAYRWMIGDMYYNADYVKTTKAMMAHRAEGRKLLDDVLGMDIERYIQKNAGNKAKVDYAEAIRDTKRALVAQSYEDQFEELIYAHEVGHMLDDRLFRKAEGFDRKASFERYGKGISAYASSDVKEYMAESFTAYYVGETENLDPDLVAIFDGMRK